MPHEPVKARASTNIFLDYAAKAGAALDRQDGPGWALGGHNGGRCGYGVPHRILGEALKVSLREAQVHREVRFLSPPTTQRCVCVFNIVLVSGEVSRVARCWRPKSEMVLRQERVRDPSSPQEQEEKRWK